jgi:glycine cleavage system regulatory protein
MATLLVLTAIGADRPGLVEALSRTVAEHGGNWLESRMSRLANRFAGILLVSVPEACVTSLKEALLRMEAEGLRIAVEESEPDSVAALTYRTARLELVGQDRAGIIRDIAEALAQHRVSIDELVTTVQSASWSGERLFQVNAELRIPGTVGRIVLREALEGIANELMVDITLDELPPP